MSIVLNSASALLQPGETYLSGTANVVTSPSSSPTSFATGLCSSVSAPPDCSSVPSDYTYLLWNWTPGVTLNGFPQANFTYVTELTAAGTLNDTDVAHYTVQGFAENPPAQFQIYVTKNIPSMTTDVSPASITLSSSPTPSATDTATLSGGFQPTGTITFHTYYSSTSTPACTDLVFTSAPVTVIGNGAYTSGPFTPSEAGYYFWTASYSGDANNTAVTTACGASGETLTVIPATPSIITSVSPSSLMLGSSPSSATDTATISGGYSPTGTLTFYVYYSTTPTAVCTDLVFTSPPVTVSGNGAYTSASFTPNAAGYYFWTASYSGDGNNTAVTTACGASGETLTVTPAEVFISTTVSPSTITIGGSPSSATDTADLTGGHHPTGTITFYVFYSATSTPACTDLVFTSTPVTVNGDGFYSSGSFTPTEVGYYFWTANYSGDANNSRYVTPCGADGETLQVLPATPSITTSVSPPSIALSKSVDPTSATDTATISGGDHPTGTITFYTYYSATSAPLCSDQVFTSGPFTVVGDGAYTSGPFTPTQAGYYFWTAAYSGDANNSAVTTACGAANETLTVSPAPGLTTSVSPSSIMVNNSAADTATLTGGIHPTGTITFYVYYSNTSTPVCTDLVWTSAPVTVTGDGSYTSEKFTPTVAGYYFWTANYSGDANNSAVTTPCGAPGETLYVFVCQTFGMAEHSQFLRSESTAVVSSRAGALALREK